MQPADALQRSHTHLSTSTDARDARHECRVGRVARELLEEEVEGVQAEFGGTGDDVSERVDAVAGAAVPGNGISVSGAASSRTFQRKESLLTHPYSCNSSSMSTSAVQMTLSFSSSTHDLYLVTPASMLRKSGLVTAMRGGGRGAGGGDPTAASEGFRWGAGGFAGPVEAKREAASESSADMSEGGEEGERGSRRGNPGRAAVVSRQSSCDSFVVQCSHLMRSSNAEPRRVMRRTALEERRGALLRLFVLQQRVRRKVVRLLANVFSSRTSSP